MAVAAGTARAPYAADPDRSRAAPCRTESPSRTISAAIATVSFIDRIPPLKHKTQVFVSHEGDHYRTL